MSTTSQSGYAGDRPKVELSKANNQWLVTVYQGAATSSDGIKIEKATVGGTILRLRANFSQGQGNTPSSPAQTIAIAFGPDEVILYDQNGQERARWQG
jgi:hypothetical protein